ncbi:unnamed protein product [Caenorhabditis auriculariae]|uniref:Meiotic spindle formation protein mei-1 n=1 Tax=Caenorhabditis auriculariae TaxID=2777116 RepID=A0A8S1H0Z2_9PELO|nr:unnamed protein product [Caenorhabditis auriculariae]
MAPETKSDTMFDTLAKRVDGMRTQWRKGNLASALELIDAIIRDVQLNTMLDTTAARRDPRKQFLTMLETERRQINTEVNSKKNDRVDAQRNSPSDPPADPDVWSPPPPRPTSAHSKRIPEPAPKNVKPTTTTKGRASVSSTTNQAAKKKARTPSSNEQPPTDGDPDKGSSENPEGKSEFDGSAYDSELVRAIESTMTRSSAQNTSWDSIAGLHDAKQLLTETVILPALIPHFFKGIRRPWRAVCMVGPPGTGKTMMAKAVSYECKTTFFCVSCGDLASKWRGDAEKMVKLLFEMARFHAPSTIFIDEIDTIGSQRGGANEHEASRRLKAQLLVEMDGFAGEDSDKRVLILAATNFPWNLDEALRRRFEKRIYIPLPDQAARRSLVEQCMKEVNVADDVDLNVIAEKLDGYSGADIVNVCRTAAIMILRRLSVGRRTIEIAMIPKEEFDQPISADDFEQAIRTTSSSVNRESLAKYEEWINEFGSV